MVVNRYVLGMYQVNCYLLADEESTECAIIDPGTECDKLDSDIENNNYNVKYIIFTHGHFDHIGGLSYYMSKYEKALVLMHKNDVLSILSENEVFYIDVENKKDVVKKIILHNDGDVFNLGSSKFKVIHTPGHSKGSVCLYTDGMLLSGDTLFERSIGRTDFVDGNFEELKNSIKNKLYILPDNTVVYPGHGDSTTIIDEKIGNPYVR